MSRWLNFDAVTVPATAGGIDLLTPAQQAILNMKVVVVTPASEIRIIGQAASPVAVAGTAANSSLVCPGGVPTTILHNGGPLKAICASGTVATLVAAWVER